MDKSKIIGMVYLLLVGLGAYVLYALLPAMIAGTIGLFKLILFLVLAFAVIFGLVRAIKKLLG